MGDEPRFYGFSERLLNERGMSCGISYCRPDGKGELYLAKPVREAFTLDLERSGAWCFDGGWGTPPGRIVVRWEGDGWRNLGYWHPKILDAPPP